MNSFFVRLCVTFLFLSTVTAGFSQQRIVRDRDRNFIHHKPAQWPSQVITQQDIPIGPAHVVNFRQVADSQAAHPIPSRTGFIGQIEDKDADFKFVPHTIPAGTPVFDPAQLPGAQRNGVVHRRESPAPLGYFLGTAGNGSLIPPDVAGAVGPTYVFETNNQQFDIYTKTGTLQSTVSIDNFFTAGGGVTGGYFDPHICYDANYGKFIVVIDGNLASNNDGAMFIAVSQTSDPTGSWWVYAIDGGDNNTADLLDYPQLGYNKNWVVITANNFVGATTTANIWVLNRASMYSGTLGTTRLFTDNNSFSWGPAETHDTTTTTLWMVQDGNGGSGAMQVGSITGTVAAPAYNAGSNVSVTSLWNENSVDAGQKGGGTGQLINSDDTRICNGAVFTNGKLWFTHAVWLPATGTATHAASDWWQITPSTLTVNQFGRIADPNGNTNYYYPTINVNANGDALLGYCVSGTDSFYGSAAYSFHAAADAANVMESRYIYKPGVATYYQTLGGGRNRYGDYTGTVVDPVDGSFWNFSEWAQAATTWGTVIAHVGPSVVPTNPPVVNFTASPTLNTCGGLVQFTDLSTNSPTAWLWHFGDGTTSTQQNPSHQYTANGTYNVYLKATNTFGSDTQTVLAYITVNLPAGPPTVNATHCGNSTFSLSANTTNPVAWFDSVGNQLSSANPFVTPALSHTTTYWVQDSILAPIDSVGPSAYNSLGAGGTFTNTNQHYLTFDALSNFTLVSVVVDASTAGVRTIQLLNSGGTVVATASPNIPAGVSTVTLNFSVPAGTGYELSCQGTVNLYRNNTVPANSYPFTLAGVVSITGNDAGLGYYYYFYNWKVRGASCISTRSAATAIIGSGGLTITPSTTKVTCYGGTNGGASVSVTGGANYTYSWSGGISTSNSISSVASGNYVVTVTDGSGCANSITVTVPQATQISVTGTPGSTSCFGASDATATVSASGGTPGFTYLWALNNQTGTSISGLAQGSYAVTATDANGCSMAGSVAVTQPNPVSATIVTTDPTFGHINGTATVSSTTGGTSPYTEAWSNGHSGQVDSNLAPGTYTVTISDAHGCTTIDTFVINKVNGLDNINGGIAFTIYPNPAKTEVVVDMQNNTAVATLELRDVLGQTLVSRTLTAAQTTIDLSAFIDGIYFIEVTQDGRKAVRRLIISR